MDIECPKYNSNKTMRRKAVPKRETYDTRVVKSRVMKVKVAEPLFYVCYNCWHKFNIK